MHKKKKNQNKYLKNLINSSVFYINWIQQALRTVLLACTHDLSHLTVCCSN